MNYKQLVPADSFMGRYLRYMESQETAYVYDWWCSLWCISAACARSTHVSRPRAPVYLNMYIVLVGDSGVARKSTSISTARGVIRSVLQDYPQVGILDAKVTPEKLDEILHSRTERYGSSEICIVVPELAVFLGTERYIAHMPTLLTDLYDCPQSRHGGGTIARGSVTQEKVWVAFLSASTPIWLLKTVNPNVIEGGFTSRCYFVLSNEPKHQMAWPTEPDADLYNDLCADIRIIGREARLHPGIGLTNAAHKFFTDWYTIRPRSIDPYKQSFESREDAHVLRVAALLCINDGSWTIMREHVETAVTLLATVKEASGKVFENAESTTKFAIGLDVIRSQLISAGMDPIPRAQLYLKVRTKLTHSEFMSLLDVMTDMGIVQRFEVKDGRGRPADLIRGTQKLLQKGIGSDLLERFT